MTEVRLVAAAAWVIAAQAMLAVMVAVAAAIAAVVIAAAADGSTIRLRERPRKRLGPARRKLCYEIFVRPERNRASLYLSLPWAMKGFILSR